MKKIPMDKIWAVLKSKRFWKRFCLGLGLLWLAGQLIAGPKTAAAVRDAMLVTDILYVENGKQDQLQPKELGCIRELRLYEPGEDRRSIEIYFQSMSKCLVPGQTITVDARHILTLYGIGAKRVFIKYSRFTYDENGNRVSGVLDLPARVDYRWKWYRWVVEDVYVYGMKPFGMASDTPVRDFLSDALGR